MDDSEPPKASKYSVYDQQVKACNVIAKPMASRKEIKKLHKLVKKAHETKCTKRGIKEVMKSIRKGSKGICLIAGDVSPIDILMHLPVYCEDKDIKYIYVPSKKDLGSAAGTKRPISVVLVTPGKELGLKEMYDEACRICVEGESKIPRL
mmetsp:Transcript_2744/g.3798  ORF Transcript_2744/g.3798 Transcript_2744/m.3798 type:complete len:150 (-) Transcript_2744:24-473(-)